MDGGRDTEARTTTMTSGSNITWLMNGTGGGRRREERTARRTYLNPSMDRRTKLQRLIKLKSIACETNTIRAVPSFDNRNNG